MLQCGRAELSPEQRAIRNRRERELLEHAWSGLSGIARRVHFWRGFVDGIDESRQSRPS